MSREAARAPPAGIYVPAVLFMHEDEEIDEDAQKAHILRLAQAGVRGILVQGSNGEAQHLSRAERKRAIAFTRETLDAHGFEGIIVIAGTGAQSARETKELNLDARDAGARFALVLTPSTWAPKMTRDTIVRFHTEVADASPIPCMVYNFPTVTAGLDLDSDVLAALAAHPNIVGVKLSCGNVGKLHRLASSFPPSSFAVFPGTAAVLLPGLLCGGAGGIMALPNVVPRVHVRLLQLWEEDKMQEATTLQAKLAHADWAVGKIGGVGGIKAIVAREWGYGAPWVRSPLAPGDATKLDANDPGTAALRELIAMEKGL